MRNFISIAIFAMAAMPAQAETQAWVQAVASGGYEARIITSDAICPTLKSDKGDAVMTVRAPANGAFPLTCAAAIPAGAVHASIGDPGCRCPSPCPIAYWSWAIPDAASRAARFRPATIPRPGLFPVAAAAAQLKPDLVIHVGDYLYREEPCPAGNAGCAGSPSGDNWASWQADFFTPAAPLWPPRPG